MTSISESGSNVIANAIASLRACSQVDILAFWQIGNENGEVVQLNDKGHVAWDGGKHELWLVQKVVVPSHLQSYPVTGLSLRLALVWWADAVEVFVNGELVAEGDLFDASPRVLLSEGVTPGEEFLVSLRVVSPGHCDGALMRSLCVYEAVGELDPGFVADELAVVQSYLERFAPHRLVELAKVVGDINHTDTEDTERGKKKSNRTEAEDAERGEEGWETLLFCFHEYLIQSNIQNQKSKISLLGHAHLDLAWLWRVCETWEAAQSTFESVLKLQGEFEELIFCHSTPALYAWVEEHRPDLFAAIEAQVQALKWEVVGGFWVEPDLNLIAGESIVRQLLYGQRYTKQKFGKLATVVWVPDTFGFGWSLPQFLVQAGVEYFVTQKLRWNDTTRFPHEVFWWRSLDGSQVFSLMSAPIGEGVDPVKMANYAWEWQAKTKLDNCLWLPGVGDHGGGPTRDMLEIARRWQNSPVFPQLEFTTAQKFLEEIKFRAQTQEEEAYPVWDDELYLEFHRGCYTTHADQKRWNRLCEGLLYEAELFAALASISAGVVYPQAELEKAWKQVLFNQFHDILPGSSITEVYADALPTWQEAQAVGSQILQQSLANIAAQISLPTPPHPDALAIVVFNPLNWERSEVVSVSLPATHPGWCVYNLGNQPLPQQEIQSSVLLFLAAGIPSVGFKVFWLCPQELKNCHDNPNYEHYTEASILSQEYFEPKIFNLENEFIQVIVDSETGNLLSIFDKVNIKEILTKSGGNLIQPFQDSGQYWDAWNIDPNYQQHPLPSPQLKSISWVEQGRIQNRLRVVQQLGKSEFSQDYILSTGSPVLKISTTVNWQESHVLVKAAFPLNLQADFATYEIPCGAISRPTKPEIEADKAKWEVPALRWADLTEEKQEIEERQKIDEEGQKIEERQKIDEEGQKIDEEGQKVEDRNSNNNGNTSSCYGVSLLNDCKYGYDSQPNQIRLTLLRSPNWPDAEADKGIHEFTYAVYPHAGTWQTAHTVRRGYELNHPLQVMLLSSPATSEHKSLPPVASLLNLSAENLILMAFKHSEDNPKKWILRCYECHGETAEISLQSDLDLTLENSVDLLERPVVSSRTIQPWKIVSFEVNK